MPEVLFFTHRGVRCGVPSKHVVQATRDPAHGAASGLWPGEALPVGGAERARLLCLKTACGPSWFEGSGMRVASLKRSEVKGLPDFLRRLMPYRHVVGLTVVNEELVWLVDPLRFEGCETQTDNVVSDPLSRERIVR